MRQGLFVKINEKKWEDFESRLANMSSLTSDELSSIYIHLTEDLAFAQSKFPNTELTRYLNELTVKVHNVIYRNKPERSSRILKFWRYEVPAELSRSYKYLGYAFLIFAAGVLIGVLSAANDETFVRLILGDQYVDMTLNNMEDGDPMAVYKGMSEGSMFFAITVNNIRVSLLAFAAGILFSVGTGYILFQNGMMLGVFHYLFFERGFFDDTILTIWIHGTLEITAIIIAGAAGIIMGNGILFPGTYPRLYAFRKAAKRGLKIVISLIPFFIVAGFLESFITRHTEWPLPVKLFIILVSISLVIIYLIVLPNLSKNEPKTHRTIQNT